MTDDNEEVAARTGLLGPDGFIMPFVLVESEGGKYDDASFVAGFQIGKMMAGLDVYAEAGRVPDPVFTKTDYAPQVDLVAMRSGFSVIQEVVVGQENWSRYTFVKEEKEI